MVLLHEVIMMWEHCSGLRLLQTQTETSPPPHMSAESRLHRVSSIHRSLCASVSLTVTLNFNAFIHMYDHTCASALPHPLLINFTLRWNWLYRCQDTHTQTHTGAHDSWHCWLLWMCTAGCGSWGLSAPISTSSPSIYLPPVVFVSVSFWLSVSYLCLLCHLAVFLRLLRRLPSDRSWQLPSGLFQALAHTHTHTRTLVPTSSALSSLFTLLLLFVTIPRHSSVLLLDSVWTYLPGGERLSKLDLRLKAPALCSRRSGGVPKWASIRSLCLFFSSLPVHLVAYSGEGRGGGGGSHRVFVSLPRESASLSTHRSFIYNEVSSLSSSPWLHKFPSFGVMLLSLSTCLLCLLVHLLLSSWFICLSARLFSVSSVTLSEKRKKRKHNLPIRLWLSFPLFWASFG